jgi:hydroxybutyrate-dimer hydrolase
MKYLKLIFLFLLLPFFAGCEDDGKGVIYAVMAVGAASGLWSAINDDDDDQSTSSTNSSSDNNSNNNDEDDTSPTEQEDFTIHSSRKYDGVNDDLLTAGLGQNGLTATPPSATDPENPTAAEIRKATIVNQYQASQDMRTNAGYGRFYGPAVANEFATPTGEGKVAGTEYLAYADQGSGQQNVTMMVQLPDSFDPDNPCIVATASPGSRGVYGAIATVGEWGLKNRCAVAYTDKGAGNGVHDLSGDTVNLIDGTRSISNDAGEKAHFRAQATAALDLAGYNSSYPYRIAQKAAHSQQNPEANWGNNVLKAIDFAFYVLNLPENFGSQDTSQSTFTAANTLVIAAGTSSGGAAALRAMEQDSSGLIDGGVVAAPLINPRHASELQSVIIQQENLSYFNTVYQKILFDVITYLMIYQPCASANTTMGLPGRCTALQKNGLLSTLTLTEQVAEAQLLLNNYGILSSTTVIAHQYIAESLYSGFAVLYANAYGKFSVVENLCDYSYAGSDGDAVPSAKTLTDLADDFQTSRGMPPSSGTFLISNQGNEGEGINFRYETDADGIEEGYLTGALCLRRLVTGTTGLTSSAGNPLTGDESQHYQRVQEGIKQIYASGDLRGKPVIIVHGRDDALAHVNFTSRAYYSLNQKTKTNSQLVYLEVKHANHFDAFNQRYNIETQIPLHYYFIQALDKLYAKLKNGVQLPSSQVIATVPTASLENRLPAIDDEDNCQIIFRDDVLTVPEC